MSIRSSIDLGTNTCLLLVVEWDPQANAIRKVLEDRSTIVRLGQGVDADGKIKPEAVKRTLDCLKDYATIVTRNGGATNETICVATSQARDSSNATDVFAEFKTATGFLFQTITGEQEARYTFLGSLPPDLDPNDVMVIDIGGGSTEFTVTRDDSIRSQSLDIGSVRFTERYLKSDPVKDGEFWQCQAVIDQALEPLVPWRKALAQKTLLGVAGTITTLAAWHLGLTTYDPEEIARTELFRGDIHRMVEELKWRSVAERRQLTGIESGRADVLLAGALILWRAMEILDFTHCRVSPRGLRYGVF